MDFDKEIENQRFKLDPQEIRAYLLCNRCAEEIYVGDEYYLYERSKLCEECFDEIQSDEKFNQKRIAGEEDE